MDQKHEQHLAEVLTTIGRIIGKKYRKGQQEHGGNLWEKSGMIDEALNEVADLAVYLVTLKQQLTNLKDKFEAVESAGVFNANNTGITHFVCPTNSRVGSMSDKCCHCNPHKDCDYQFED